MFLSDRVGARVIYLWIRMQAATDRVYTSGTQNSEKKSFNPSATRPLDITSYESEINILLGYG